ncbi:DUF1643 domain-containing protein [Spirosoma sp.]|uniref:DUF1643 domain-containing protein n=1 Tax=Spirosoma sp. TaxID=1899569 RepID=UPI0026263F12|nr:DUF1643 domain-containing protein [Spirosoma sp.]MCX6217585.1 DUF1643 domain-containing protein [Spirosoma sp.]
MNRNQVSLFPEMQQGATFAENGKYRYLLWRIWDDTLPLATIVGLNPSTADDANDDPTIRRCISFLKGFGYGGFYMTNLFAFRATEPAVMKDEAEPVGMANDEYLRYAKDKSSAVLFAWGTDGGHRGRDQQVIDMFPHAYCLGKTKDGHPRHPLYLPSSTKLIPFRDYVIDGRVLVAADIGSKVTYVPTHAHGNRSHPDCEPGTLIGWNSVGAMVDYVRNKCRTDYTDLVWG